MESDVNKALIFAYFARQTSPLQRERIGQWLRERTNEEQFYEWLDEWETMHPQYVARSDKAYERYARYVGEHLPDDVTDRPSPRRTARTNGWLTRWFIAASVLLVVGGSGAVLFRQSIVYVTYATPFGESRAWRLPDASAVVLRPNSTLRVPRWGFGRRTRHVRLTGEAEFRVTHTPTNQRFVVQTDQHVDVVVLGTEFTVSARQRGATVRLNRGRVVLRYRQGEETKQLTMKPGQLATLDRGGHVALNTPSRAPLRPAEAGKRFVFDETPLREVAYLLEDHYGLQVDLSDRRLADRVLMGSLRADNVDQLLQSISELLDINVVRQGNRVQLRSHLPNQP